MRKLTSALLSTLLAAAVLGSGSTMRFVSAAEEKPAKPVVMTETEPNYQKYREGLEGAVHTGAEAPLVLLPERGRGTRVEDTPSGTVFIEEDAGEAVFSADVPEDGLYVLALDYYLDMENSRNAEITVTVDGAVLHKSLRNLKLRSVFESEAIRQDYKGNDLRPGKIEKKEWISWFLTDYEIDSSALVFRFSKGRHEIAVRSSQKGLGLKNLRLTHEPAAPGYDEYRRAAEGNGEAPEGYLEYVQGESAVRTSDSVLYPTYDRSGAATMPSDPVKLKLNTIGLNTWNRPGQWIEWVIRVPADGWYELGARVRQNGLRGFYSTRKLTLNGEALFREAEELRFPYRQSWYVTAFGGEEPYRFWLEAGRDYVLRLEAVSGPVAEMIAELDRLTLELNDIYRGIIMITGPAADQYRDYMLDEQIPDLLPNLKQCREDLYRVMKALAKSGVRGGTDAVVLEKLIFQIDSFLKEPDTIALRLANFLENIGSMSAWALSLKNQPLEIDYLFVKSPDAEMPKANAPFFRQMAYRFKAFVASYTNDYSGLHGAVREEGEPLNVWVAVGRDQGQIIKDLTENEFREKYGASVNISLMQTGLNEAVAAGRGPEVVLFAGDVVNLASRGVLADLSKFPAFDEIKKRFAPNAFNPFTYDGKIYAVPLEQSVLMMFYRKDVFAELGLKVPETWDEFDEVLAALQKEKLTAGLYAGTSTMGDTSVFEILLYQSGGRVYREDLTGVELESERSVAAFERWTNYYKRYSLPTEFNFYNRFRTGEMPIGIQGQGMYATLKLAAPEIKGLWEMVPIPQTVGPDGSATRMTLAAVTPGIVLKNKREELCLSYLSWFTETHVQVAYGREVENVLGVGARYNTANLNAVSGLNWSRAESELLRAELEKSYVTPQIPASYYVGRNITNAFRKVVIGGYRPREALMTYGKIINSEIERKNEEIRRRAERQGGAGS